MYEAVIAATLLGIPVISWVVVVLLAAVLAWGIVLIVRYERELRGKVRHKPAKRSKPELQQVASDTVEQSAEAIDAVQDDDLPVSVDVDEQAEVEDLVADELDEELNEQPIDEPQAVEVVDEEQPVEAVAEELPAEDESETAVESEPVEQVNDDSVEEPIIDEQPTDDGVVEEQPQTDEAETETVEAEVQAEEQAEAVVIDEQIDVDEAQSSDEHLDEVAESEPEEQEAVVDEPDVAFTVSAEEEFDESTVEPQADDAVAEEQSVEAVVEELPAEDESETDVESEPVEQVIDDSVAESIIEEQPEAVEVAEAIDDTTEAVEVETTQSVEDLTESESDVEPSDAEPVIDEQPIEELADVTAAAEAESIIDEQPVEPSEGESDVVDTDEVDEAGADGAEADEAMSGELVFADKTIFVRYSKSFTAKLMQSSDETKQFYAEIANCLLSYKKVNSRISWAYSSFNRGRTKLAKLVIRGKSLNLYLALNPSTVEKKYHVLDVSNVRKYAEVPCRLRIKSARAVKYAKELIGIACGNLQIPLNPKFAPTVQAADYPYDTTENLIISKLIKVNALNGEVIPEEHIVAGGFTLRESVSVDEAHALITDETAATLVEIRRTAPVSGKKYIVNIDMLSGNFNAGDVVDIEALKRKKLVPRKEVAIKVLARGVLNKPLTVKANDFSSDAIKMIVLTGGKAIKI